MSVAARIDLADILRHGEYNDLAAAVLLYATNFEAADTDILYEHVYDVLCCTDDEDTPPALRASYQALATELNLEIPS
jgi:hypothetical protein